MRKLYDRYQNSYLRLIINSICLTILSVNAIFDPETVPNLVIRFFGIFVILEAFTTIQQIYIKYLLDKNQKLKNKIDENNRNMSCTGVGLNHSGMRQTNIYDV